MAIRDIITITDYQGPQPASQVAIEIARLTEAHATGLALAFEPLLPGFVAAPMPADYLQMARQQALQTAKDSLKTYQHLLDLAGVNGEGRIEEVLMGGALEGTLSQCRLSDLVAITQDNPDNPEPMRTVFIEALLFDAGTPLLIVPHVFKGAFKPKKAVVAWNGSASAARAVRASMPLLQMMDEVRILIIDENNTDDREPGAAVATYLARHNLKVEIDVITKPEISTSNAILNYLSDNDSDLLVMGGYGHSRMREMLLGGVTRDILANMTVPVLMSH